MGIASIVQFISAKLGFSLKRGVALPDERYFLRPTLEMVLTAYLGANPSARFIQIGASDGKETDIARTWVDAYGLKGILVEPLPEAFSRLVENYGGREGLLFENAAISPGGTPLPFFRLYPDYAKRAKGPIKERPLPDRLSSFDREHILRHVEYNGDWKDIIEEIQIPCLSLAQLVEKHAYSGVEILFVDAEGYDYPILMENDWDKVRPEVILFEHVHIDRKDRERLTKRLIEAGYLWVPVGINTIAVRKDVTLGGEMEEFPT